MICSAALSFGRAEAPRLRLPSTCHVAAPLCPMSCCPGLGIGPKPEGTSMNARSARAVTTYRVVTIALAVLAVGGWTAFAYVSWSAARTERALQSQITRLNTDRNGTAAARKQQGQESAATRTVYPAPYGTSAPRPAQVVSSAAPLTAAPTAPTPRTVRPQLCAPVMIKLSPTPSSARPSSRMVAESAG